MKIEVSYNAGRLAHALPMIMNKTMIQYAGVNLHAIRESIATGTDIETNQPFAPLTTNTKYIRKMGFGKYGSPIDGDDPLIATGKLLMSIRMQGNAKTGNLEITAADYGKYHQTGYNIKANKFTRFYFMHTSETKKPHKKPQNIAGAYVPPRRFFGKPDKSVFARDHTRIINNFTRMRKEAMKLI